MKMTKNTKYFQLCLVIICFTLCMFMILRYTEESSLNKFIKSNEVVNQQDHSGGIPALVVKNKYSELVFGDNITGFPDLIVPNIVHNVLFGINEIKFSHFISILSVLKNQRPDIFFIHCDCDHLTGDYFERVLEKAKKTNTKIIVRKVEKPTEIYGIKLSKSFVNWHGSDITRLRALTEFGGIYVDNDVYVIQSLDFFRKFEMSINWDEGLYLGNQVIIAHKKARFLSRYLDSYHAYDASKWYYNAGDLPTISILYKNPELVHRVKGGFGVNAPAVCPKIYSSYYENWRKEFYTVHLVMRGHDITWPDWCFGNRKPKVMTFNEQNVMQLNVTFGEMCRDVLNF